jgi:hypothetical protein
LKKEKYFLKGLISGSEYYFTTSTDNRYRGEETFSTKEEGGNLLVSLIEDDQITKCNAYDLICEIISNPDISITYKIGKDEEEIEKIKTEAEEEILRKQSVIRRMTLSETEKGLPKFVFPPFEAGVCLVTKDEVYGVFPSKKDLLGDEHVIEYLKEHPQHKDRLFSEAFDLRVPNTDSESN